MAPLCPRCEAERALQDMRAMYDWEPVPDVNVYAHAAGMAEGSLTLLLDCPLELCERHGNLGGGLMDRPTKERVQEALDATVSNDVDAFDARVLAAEVRALREEIAARRASHDTTVGIIRRILALGSSEGGCMGDDTLIRLGDIRDVLKGGA